MAHPGLTRKHTSQAQVNGCGCLHTSKRLDDDNRNNDHYARRRGACQPVDFDTTAHLKPTEESTTFVSLASRRGGTNRDHRRHQKLAPQCDPRYGAGKRDQLLRESIRDAANSGSDSGPAIRADGGRRIGFAKRLTTASPAGSTLLQPRPSHSHVSLHPGGPCPQGAAGDARCQRKAGIARLVTQGWRRKGWRRTAGDPKATPTPSFGKIRGGRAQTFVGSGGRGRSPRQLAADTVLSALDDCTATASAAFARAQYSRCRTALGLRPLCKRRS